MKAFDCVDHNKVWKVLKSGSVSPPGLFFVKIVLAIKVS